MEKIKEKISKMIPLIVSGAGLVVSAVGLVKFGYKTSDVFNKLKKQDTSNMSWNDIMKFIFTQY